MNQTIQKAINAYGGKERWEKAKSIEAEFSASGLAFIFKNRVPFQRANLLMDISRPNSKITPIGKNQNVSGILDGSNVRLENSYGDVIQERKDARQKFSGVRRKLYWDDLDMAYFANYAMWNYLSLPALLLRTDIIWNEIEEGFLEAIFPKELPTHNQKQYFRFDIGTGLLIQHDYTAEVISRFAKAAHVVLSHSESDGLKFTSHRRVTPRLFNGKPMKGPTLIEIFIHKFLLKNELV